MADDLDFMFSGTRPVIPLGRSGSGETDSPGLEWVTLRTAYDRTGIPISTLRKWARKGRVRAKLQKGSERDLRLVVFDDIRRRAESLGRLEPAEPVGSVEVEDIVVDLRPASVPRAPAPEPARAPSPPTDDETGSILVPLEAWQRMLNQLGNLHEAGQQLAEARERAAKAETEAAFLRDRLREYRKLLAEADAATTVIAGPMPTVDIAPVINTQVLQGRFRSWRRRWFG